MATAKTKVFVGNLSFKATTEELRREFDTVGKVVNANIISRGNRSLGYGFVEFNTEEDANKAVTAMNKRKIDDREINVEIANPRDESKPPVRRNFRGYQGRGGYNRGRYNNNRGGRGYSRGVGNFRRRMPRGGLSRRSPPNIEGRTPSNTTLFVANIPYSLNDEGLAKVFSGLSVKSAHVVIRRNGKSKGFGFVEFNNEEDQKKGLNGDKKTVEGRELVIKVALMSETNRDNRDNRDPAPKPMSPATNTTTNTTSPTSGKKNVPPK